MLTYINQNKSISKNKLKMIKSAFLVLTSLFQDNNIFKIQ